MEGFVWITFWHFVLLNEWRIYLVGFIWSLQDDQKWAHQHQQQECRISSLFKFSNFLHPKFTVYVCVVVSWLALKVFNGCKWHWLTLKLFWRGHGLFLANWIEISDGHSLRDAYDLKRQKCVKDEVYFLQWPSNAVIMEIVVSTMRKIVLIFYRVYDACDHSRRDGDRHGIPLFVKSKLLVSPVILIQLSIIFCNQSCCNKIHTHVRW